MERTEAPKLPVDGKRNILITSALPYVNNVPHLGNIIGCVLSADVFARYCRLRGYNAIYICGTDEYGTAMEVKALLEKCGPREICDRYHIIHKEVYDWFQISFDKFGRTSAPEHTELCQGIFNKLLENNFLFESTMQQLYCDQCELFLADSFVVGTCPNPDCCYEQSKGDQCENCGKMLDPTELRNPMCKLCKGTPVLRDTRHFFIDLPSLCDKLESYICKTSNTGCWSHYAIANTRGLLQGGLKPRCITRDLRWGVPVPLDDFGEKVLYVWFDAPIGYISITKSYTPEWEKWWKNPENVELYQFMGKDNVQFHTVMFPSVLLGTGENWTMAKSISSTQFLNYLTGKFSKSQGVGINGKQVKETNIPVEVWRYYLLCNRPEVSDTRFCWDDLQAKLNRELIANLGNFVNRVLRFLAKPPGQGYGSIIPDITGAESDELTQNFGERIGEYVDLYVEEMEKVKLKRGLKIAMLISSEGNSYLQESKFWMLYKQEKPRCSIVLKTSVGVVYLLACLLEPFMPSVSAEVMKQLNLASTMISLQDEDRKRARAPWQIVPPGHKIGQPKPLFNELTDKELEVFKDKFAGCQTSGSVENECDAVSRQVTDNHKQFNEIENSDVKGSDRSCGTCVGHATKAQKHTVVDSVRVKEIEVNEGPPVVAGDVDSCISSEEIQGMKSSVSGGVNPIIIHDKSPSAEVVAASNGELLKVGSITLAEVEVAADGEMVSGLETEPNGAMNAEGVVGSVRDGL